MFVDFDGLRGKLARKNLTRTNEKCVKSERWREMDFK